MATAFPTATGTTTPIPTPIVGASTTTDPALSNAAQDLRGYVFADETIAIFLQWVESANALSGTASFAQPDAASASGVKAMSVGFTGVRAGKQITFTVPFGSGAPTTWTGVLDVLSLAMYFPTTNGTISPLTLHPGTAADYNQAVLTLQQRVTQVQSTCTMRFDQAGEDLGSASQWLDYKWYYQVDHNAPGGHRYQIIGPFDTASDAESYGNSRFRYLGAPTCVGQLTPDQPLGPEAQRYHPRNT